MVSTKLTSCRNCGRPFQSSDLKQHRRWCSQKHEEVALIRKNLKKALRRKMKKTLSPALEKDVEMQENVELPPEVPEPTPAMSKRAPSITLAPTRFSNRKRTFPRHLTDFFSSSRTPVPHIPAQFMQPKPSPKPQPPPSPSSSLEEPSSEAESEEEYRVIPPIFTHITEPNDFGVFRAFTHKPAHDPEEDVSMEDLTNAPTFPGTQNPEHPLSNWATGLGTSDSDSEEEPDLGPFGNETRFRILKWADDCKGVLSGARVQCLIDTVILAPGFKPEDLEGFSYQTALNNLDKALDDKDSPFSAHCGWKEGSITIPLTCEGRTFESPEEVPTYTVTNVHYRSLVDIIKTAFSSPSASNWTYVPHGMFWKEEESDEEPERIISEVYHGDAWIREDQKLQAMPVEYDKEGNVIEKAVAAMQYYSDQTRVANFGPASLHPIYVYFANQSKYERAIPSKLGAHHVAYIPELPEELQDVYEQVFEGVHASPAVLRQLKKELFHGIWRLVQDEEFMMAYREGILVRCADQILRRLFPRVFIYSADYPEKCIIATIQYLAEHPCPRCKIRKDQLSELGNSRDDARREKRREDTHARQYTLKKVRKQIYLKGKAIEGKALRKSFKFSETPIQNAFSAIQEADPSFNFYDLLAPDLLHEFELGIWKNVFKHVLQLLYSVPGDKLFVVNKRYRAISTFGRLTIRRFGKKVTSMKKMAGRDFEDLLQCSIPVFEGLMAPADNKKLLDLLWILCVWHALAKLRLHTQRTKRGLRRATRQLGSSLRSFRAKVSKKYGVLPELPSDAEARYRREARAQGKGKKVKPKKVKEYETLDDILNLSIPKMHALGYYAPFIFEIGTCDNSSTQLGEQEHKRVKVFYVRTNKNVTFRWQITKQERRQRFIKNIKDRLRKQRKGSEAPKTTSAVIPFEESEPLHLSSPKHHHHISPELRFPITVSRLLEDNKDDPAYKNFLPLLKDHLLARILATQTSTLPEEIEITAEVQRRIGFSKNRIFKHKVLRVNFTTYDMRRDQDSINPRNHPDIMVLAQDTEDDSHPYWYARVYSIFHATVQYNNPATGKREEYPMEFLWVRWFGREAPVDQPEGYPMRPPLLSFYEDTGTSSREAFGFVDPADVVRGVHLVPAFADGMTDEFLRGTNARQAINDEGLERDYCFYYVNIFVDRDMFMRFIGGGVGHKGHRVKAVYNITDDPEDDGEDSEEGDESDVEEDEGEGENDNSEEEKEEGGDEWETSLGPMDCESDSEEESYSDWDGLSEHERSPSPDSAEEASSDDDNLGAEDGEEDWAEDEVENLGYSGL